MKRIIAVLILSILVLFVMASCASGDMIAPNIDDETSNTNGTATNDSTDSSGNQNNTTADNSEPTNQTPKPEKKVIKFVGTGDALIHSAVYWEAEEKATQKSGYNGNYYFNDMYSGVSEIIKNADIAFVNHEAPIAKTAISGYPNFNAPSESGDALVELGFNVVNIANNHMYDVDHKITGYADTIDYWNTKDVMQIGGYKDENDFNTPRILTVDGVNIAFLAYTYDPARTNGTHMNSKSQTEGYINPVLDDYTLEEHVKAAKEKADLVIVSAHWGTENQFRPNNEQERMSVLMADLGVDVIIGHHSHTVQPIEWITGKEGNKTLCVYSLGNFISGMLSSKNHVGGFITFDIVKENGKTEIQNPIFEPTVCHYDIENFSKKDADGNPVRTGFQVYMMKDYTFDMAKKHGTQNYGSFTLDTLKGYVTSAISSEFLPQYLK